MGAIAAGLGAGAAVVVHGRVFLAFGGAVLAHFDTQGRGLGGHFAVARDVRGRERAHLRAVEVELDAAREARDFLFVEAGLGAELASGDAILQQLQNVLFDL